MKLAELFTNNYEYLNTVAKRITRRRDHRLAPELLNTTYLCIHEKQQKGLKIPEANEEFVKWFSKFMSNYFIWTNSEFNKSLRMDIDEMERSDKREYSRYRKDKVCYQSISEDNFRGELDSNPQGPEGIIDEDAHRNIEIHVEQANDFTKELIDISSSLGKNKTLKYIELVEFKRGLPSYEVILFELYFEKELSTRKIADLYSIDGNVMNYQSVNAMVNKIKLKLKEYQWMQSAI